MDNKKKIHVFVNSDLDGSACYLTLQWYLWNIPTYTLTNHTNMQNDVSKWMLKNKVEDYDHIYFVSLDTCPIASLIDKKNVTVYDHHQEAKRCSEVYKQCRFNIFEFGSTVLGLYRHLKERFPDRTITSPQRKFIALVDDYISYRLLEKDISIGLNMLYWNYQGDKIQKLKNDFNNGFVEFTPDQLKIIDFYKGKIQQIIDKSDFYVGDFKIQGIFRKIIATFSDVCINEVASELTNLGYEIAIIINPNTQKVSFRKNHRSNIDLNKVAETLADGGGYKNTAGGLITEKFLNFTSLLQKNDIRTRT